MNNKFLLIAILFFSIFSYSQTSEQDCETARKQYLIQNPDVAKAGMNAWSHYISYGKREGRKWPECKSESLANSIQSNLATWKHSNGKIVQTDKLSNNYRKIWVEDDNRFSYEEFSIEGQVVILKDLNRNGVYLKLMPNECYYKDNNNSSWLYIYSGSWSIPLKPSKTTNAVVIQKNNEKSKVVTQNSISPSMEKNNLVKTSLGKFHVQYLGTGDWNFAATEAQKIGYRLPTGEEFSAIMNKTPLTKLGELGFRYSNGRYYWTSKDDDSSWADSARKTNALVIWWGSGQVDKWSGYKSPDAKLMVKSFGTLGIVAIKKAK